LQLLDVNDQIRTLIDSRSGSGAIFGAAHEAGMTTMFEHGIAKCRAGLTSAAEVVRVTTVR
jgi:general secretion pathway protein E